MATAEASQSLIIDYDKALAQASPVAKFLTWCNEQQHNRLVWVAVSLTTHCCVITPITLLAILTSTASFFLVMVGILTMEVIFVTNLTIGSTKITIPLYFGSIFINVGIILYSIGTVVL